MYSAAMLRRGWGGEAFIPIRAKVEGFKVDRKRGTGWGEWYQGDVSIQKGEGQFGTHGWGPTDVAMFCPPLFSPPIISLLPHWFF